MKKIILLFVGFFLCLAALGAENIKFKVGGDSRRYNQIKVVNYTNATNFDCEAFLLEDRDGKFVAQESLGCVHLRNNGGSDTVTMINLIRRGDNLGLAVPEQAGDFSYTVEYKDYPFFDVIEIKLLGADNPLGKEF
ncbi:MAG: hypothetical protein II610_01420 [Treponema sp.]|nr:hypothetical protein [Treponema sp.]